MAIFIDEHISSQRGTESENPTAELIVPIIVTEPDLSNSVLDPVTGADIGTVGPATRTALIAWAPSTFDGLVPTSYDTAYKTRGVWTGTIQYGMRKKPEIGDIVTTINTTGGTHHITQSLEQVKKYPAPGTVAPDADGIGDQGKGELEGVDIHMPAFSYSVTGYFTSTAVDTDFINTLFLLTANVNDAAFKIFNRGECLFLGATLTQRSTQPHIEAAFDFVGSVNADKLSVGDITGIVKQGWEYLWVRYRTAEGAKTLIQKPLAVYIERVYKYGNFAQIGIGT